MTAATITNPELKELDERVSEFYKITSTYLSTLHNLYGRGIYKGEQEKILKESERINPETDFDAILIKNIQSNLRLNDLVIDFIALPDFSLSVIDFIEKIAGEGTWRYLEQKVKNAKWEERWKFLEKNSEREYARINPYAEEAQKSAKSWIPRIKKDVLEYGKQEGYLPENFDMGIYLLSPEGGTWSTWNPKTKILSLASSNNFEFFPEREGITAIPVRAYRTVFHELLGHGAHQIHSEELPPSIRLTELIGGITPTKSITEEIAKEREGDSYDFLRTKLVNKKFTEEDVELLEEEDKFEHQGLCEQMFLALINERKMKEGKFNDYDYLLELTNNPILAKEFRETIDKTKFPRIWRQIGHTLGPLHYKKMLEKVKREFGDDFIEHNKKKFNRATLRGVWSWEVYPNAVCYFLRNDKTD